METIKKGIHDADAEARSVARKCYWSYQAHFRREADQLFQSLEASYQKALQAHQRGGENSVTSLPASDRSSSSSQESLSRPPPVKNTFGSGSTRTKASHGRPPVPAPPPSLQRSRSDVDVNAASSSARRMPAVPAAFSSASTLPPGSYASLDDCSSVSADGRVRTQRTTSGNGSSVTDSRGRSRGKISSQSQREQISMFPYLI
ncbi:CLIP-associating protein 1-like [Notothenia coriiceps]|uniref:CLIP-associating protein 1-like n=1 Tax=Notothenia coriiceps TaxID=8208 RepID=A0A6I9NQA4_9TELE|nr:PREDICTED: CLIP-associating protein 1-like [Notothenia coriiceps]